MNKIRHYRLNNSSDIVEFEVKDAMYDVTTCVVDVEELIAGRNIFPCGSGSDFIVRPDKKAEIIRFVNEQRKSAHNNLTRKLLCEL